MPSEDIISRLAARLAGATGNNRVAPDIGTRSMGGSFRTNHPYVSGYFQIVFELPDELFASNKEEATKWLTSTAESFTPPSVSINPIDINGLGQMKSRFYGSRTITNDITVAFREFQNLPVLNIIAQWVGVFDPFVGVSSLKGNMFIPQSYKGTIYVLQTKPVGAFAGQTLTTEDIDEAWVFDGAWPTSLPYDALNSDLGTSDGVQYSVTFSYDGYPLTSSEGAIARCLEAYNALGHTSYLDTQAKYESALGVSGSAENLTEGS